MLRQRLAVQGPREKRIGRHRLLTVQAAAERHVDLELLRPPLDFLFTMIGAEENELPRRRLHARRVEHGLERHAGPAPVAAQAVERTTVARAFEAGDELHAAHFLQVVERELFGPIHETRHFQSEGCRIDVRMAVVLSRRELVARRERTVDGPKIEQSPIGGCFPSDVVGNIGEGHERLPLRERREHPFRYAEDTQPRHSETPSEDVTTRGLIRHVVDPFPQQFRRDGCSDQVKSPSSDARSFVESWNEPTGPEADMRVRRHGFVVAILACVALASPLTPAVPIASQAPELGTIQFPTSGAPTAQPAFIEGVKDLHSFEFDEAAAAFKNAQQADPNFALAYWGEAMSYNHPLWAQVDVEAGRKALGKLAPTLEGRLTKAKMPREKAYVEAVDQLFSAEGDKLARDQAYSQAMARMYRQWPDDHEVATFYALSLLGTVRPGDKGFRRQALAASIVEQVFKENPNHPGAAHFIIHAFDDPDHAPLGLTAARAYSKIAPSAPHALHMPSHIFVQLGMWDDVAASNTVAYKAAIDLLARMHLTEGREDFHTLSWLEYANLMRGKFDEAKKN